MRTVLAPGDDAALAAALEEAVLYKKEAAKRKGEDVGADHVRISLKFIATLAQSEVIQKMQVVGGHVDPGRAAGQAQGMLCQGHEAQNRFQQCGTGNLCQDPVCARSEEPPPLHGPASFFQELDLVIETYNTTIPERTQVSRTGEGGENTATRTNI
eukprot:TRINITY_DN37722_c0_g1_i1.p2 TRINITY_DN37722_c0_g1~~TRINITY_DN37722_c0_g1_i1.p2  ORF type:complete len:156 (-),score=26.29 TRINITY_DN37722_c0_g1_i1:195-662(-)